MKFTKKEKEELAERFNISIATFYNWEKNKPELIKVIELGINKEKEINLSKDLKKESEQDILEHLKKLEERIQLMEIIQKGSK
jgi:transcriptional regulator with XRE-family HTH domain